MTVATAEKGEHAIHIWNRDNGQLILKLDGPKESIWDVAWHPSRSILASCGQSGKVRCVSECAWGGEGGCGEACELVGACVRAALTL